MGFITPYHANDEFFPQTDDILIKTYNSQSFNIEIITFYREFNVKSSIPAVSTIRNFKQLAIIVKYRVSNCTS